jgi:hypothetical protein
MKEEIIQWLESGADYHTGCLLFQKYSNNTHAKRYVFVSNNNYPALRLKLKEELCRLAGIEFNPLKPEDVKKKSKSTGKKQNQKRKSKAPRATKTPKTELQQEQQKQTLTESETASSESSN